MKYSNLHSLKVKQDRETISPCPVVFPALQADATKSHARNKREKYLKKRIKEDPSVLEDPYDLENLKDAYNEEKKKSAD